jgi:hypothetical protein
MIPMKICKRLKKCILEQNHQQLNEIRSLGEEREREREGVDVC